MAHKRAADGTTQMQRVFRALRQCSMTVALLEEALGEPAYSIHQSLHTMILNGKIRRVKCAHKICTGMMTRRHRTAGVVVQPRMIRPTMFAVVPHKKEPRDRRGKSAGSHTHGGPHGAVAWAHWLRMMQRKHGPEWVYRPPGTLESLWVRRKHEDAGTGGGVEGRADGDD